MAPSGKRRFFRGTLVKRFRVLTALTYNDPLYQQGIVEYASNADWELDMLVAYYGIPPTYWKGDGIITNYLYGEHPVLNWVRKQKVPVVSINADEVPCWPGSVPDHRACGLLAAEHFLSLGFKNFAYFRCSDQASVIGRQTAFIQKIVRHGGSVHLLDWRAISQKRTPVMILTKQIEKLPKPLGIFCQSDHRASTLFTAIQEAGLQVPDDVAILSVGNNENLCNLAHVPLSSIDIDLSGVAREAAAMLDRLMRGGLPPCQPIVVPPTGIVRRRSTLAVHVGHPIVNEAMRFILSNFSQGINANDVIRHVKMSRAGLSRLFKKHFGHSISEMLLRTRMEQIRHELLTTNRKIYEICETAGFSSYIHFSKAFYRCYGFTASEFRKSHRSKLPQPEEPEM